MEIRNRAKHAANRVVVGTDTEKEEELFHIALARSYGLRWLFMVEIPDLIVKDPSEPHEREMTLRRLGLVGAKLHDLAERYLPVDTETAQLCAEMAERATLYPEQPKQTPITLNLSRFDISSDNSCMS